MLGFAAAVIVNVFLRAVDLWFPTAVLFVAFLPLVYYLLWHLVIGPLNDALGVEGERARAVDVPQRAI
jgi:hypothetical protein